MAEVWQALIAALPAIKVYGILLAVIAGFMILEQLFPAERGQPVRNKILTAEFTLLYLVITPIVIALPMYLVTWARDITGGPLFTLNLDPIGTGSAPLDWALRNIVFPSIPFIVFDFFYYWHHRLQHVVPVLWEQHKLHHMDESVYCISSGRHHWLEEVIRVFTVAIPMAILVTVGMREGTVMALVFAQWAIFIHVNVRLPLGPLTPVLCGPQLHRIHHSRDPRHIDKNLAAFFPLWDILFGTYCRPQPGEWAATGITSREVATGFWDGVIMPFRAWVPALVAQFRRVISAMAGRPRG
jgi:sterol desaturase/sphingolipid hydroxylase (fatty acid hydroxylase superfamily)